MTTRPPQQRSHVIRQVPYEHPDVDRLVKDLQAVYISIYGEPDATPVEPGEFAAGRRPPRQAADDVTWVRTARSTRLPSPPDLASDPRPVR